MITLRYKKFSLVWQVISASYYTPKYCFHVTEIEFPVICVSMSIASYFWHFIGKTKGPLKSSQS